MTGNIRGRVAQRIRRIDGDNTMPAAELGHWLAGSQLLCHFKILGADMAEFVSHINYDKTMCASTLADAIVDHFNLDTED